MDIYLAESVERLHLIAPELGEIGCFTACGNLLGQGIPPFCVSKRKKICHPQCSDDMASGSAMS
jgi:hypothetical protein